jgi:hypothetical protein
VALRGDPLYVNRAPERNRVMRRSGGEEAAVVTSPPVHSYRGGRFMRQRTLEPGRRVLGALALSGYGASMSEQTCQNDDLVPPSEV